MAQHLLLLCQFIINTFLHEFCRKALNNGGKKCKFAVAKDSSFKSHSTLAVIFSVIRPLKTSDPTSFNHKYLDFYSK